MMKIRIIHNKVSTQSVEQNHRIWQTLLKMNLKKFLKSQKSKKMDSMAMQMDVSME